MTSFKCVYRSLPICNIRCGDRNGMRQALCIYGNMAFDSRNFFPTIKSLFFCRICIFNALWIYNDKACLLTANLLIARGEYLFFLTRVPTRSFHLHLLHSRWQNRNIRCTILGNHEANSAMCNHFTAHRALHRKYHINPFDVDWFSCVHSLAGDE